MRAVIVSFALGLGLGTVLTATASDFNPIRAVQPGSTRRDLCGSRRYRSSGPPLGQSSSRSAIRHQD